MKELGNIDESERYLNKAKTHAPKSVSQVREWDYVGPFIIGKYKNSIINISYCVSLLRMFVKHFNILAANVILRSC